MDVDKLKKALIAAGEVAVKELIKVANKKIVGDLDVSDDLAVDKLKTAAAAKKLAIFDAFEILGRIESEKNILEEGVSSDGEAQGFAERKSKK